MSRRKKKEAEVISVYQLMEINGLKTSRKKNVKVSHEIMMRKLCLRNEKFPDMVNVPIRLSFDKIIDEALARGVVIMVRDDYGVIYPYLINRRKCYETYPEVSHDNIPDGIRPGYQKYLERKHKKIVFADTERRILEDEKMLLEAIKDTLMEPDYSCVYLKRNRKKEVIW